MVRTGSKIKAKMHYLFPQRQPFYTEIGEGRIKERNDLVTANLYPY